MTLRIQKSSERELTLFRLIGRIQGDHLPALQALMRSEGPEHNLILDLKEVKLVDRDAVRFLAQSEADGARLKNCSAFIREWISQETKGMTRPEAQDLGEGQQ
jgi:anti-anti-sigma regulatory factor